MPRLHSPLEVPKLVTPLRHDTPGVLQESSNNQEATNSREVGLKGLRVDFCVVLDLASESSELLDRVIWICGPVAGGGS